MESKLAATICEAVIMRNCLAGLWEKMRNSCGEQGDGQIDADGIADDSSTNIGSNSVKFLVDLASESFKRQLELDESVWRSLPFFAATFAFVATIIGKSSEDVPRWGESLSGNVAFIMLMFSVSSLAWALRWFWVVIRPREYEYPAPDSKVMEYAVGIRQFYADSGVSDPERLDEKTLGELRLFMIDQYGSASTTNLRHNAVKLKARPKVLLFMLLGFALAFVCEAIIFIGTHVGAQPVEQGVATDGTTTKPDAAATSGKQSSRASEARTPKITVGERGGQLLGREFQAGHQEQAVSRSRTPVPPPSSSDTRPQRPLPPLPQVIAKDRSLNEGANPPIPAPSGKKD
ncbi:hypothetical protein [Sphingomonas parapaucimobilis]|nr:hypothetical protein [Sphingomonas parapaucimobilis]